MALQTVIDIELIDGQIVKASMTYGKLYKLSAKHKTLYKKHRDLNVNCGGQLVAEEIAFELYVAYACENCDSDLMDLYEFMDLLPPNPEEIQKLFEKLQPKKEKN